MTQSLISSLKRFTSLDQFSLVHRAVPLPSQWRHKGKNSSSPCHPGKCMGKPWCSPATAEPGPGPTLQPQETLLHQKRIWRRFSCHSLGRGSESVWKQLEEERGHCESHSCSAVVRSPSNGHISSTWTGRHRAQGSAVRRLHKGSLLAQTLQPVCTALSLQSSWVKKCGCLEVILPVFWLSNRTGLVLHQKKLIQAMCILGISAGFGCNLPARNPSISSCLQLGIHQIPTNGIQKHVRI